MAKVIVKRLNCREKMLKLISWKEILNIYCQSVLIVFYIGLVNIYKKMKGYFNTRVREQIKRQMLSAVRGECGESGEERRRKENKNTENQSISPLTLTSRLGAHKYIKINVSF